jgi:hypothetical protein
VTTTFNDLVNEVTLNLAGFTLQQDRTTYLKNAVTTTTSSSASPTILTLGSTESVGKGIVEIDEELMWVDSYDRVANTATVAPYGRGYMGSTAATHTADTKVVISPTFPRMVIKKAINDTIRAMGSQLYGIGSTTFTYTLPQTTYALNNLNMRSILNVQWQTVGPTKQWAYVRHWDWDSKADETEWGSGAQTITLGDYITPGRTVKITYGKDPSVLTNANDDYTTVTGFEASSKDVLVYGACWRLLSFLDPARASMVSPQADETDSKRPYGASQSAVKQLYTLYQQRLQEEVLEQQRHYPIRVHYARR